MKRADSCFLLGLGFYAFPAFAVAMKQTAVVMFAEPTMPLPFTEIARFTDRYLPAFYLCAIPSLAFLFLSFAYLNLSPVRLALLSFVGAYAVFFAIPSLTWPIGNTYYETLSFYLGQVSLILIFLTTLLYFQFGRGR